MSPPEMRRPRHGSGADADTWNYQPPDSSPSPGHERYMRQLERRIAWLSHRRHWWLRTPEGRSQLEFIERRDAA